MRRSLQRATALAAVLAWSACLPARPPRRPPPLSPDSQRVLDRALRLARPAYATQQQAIRAGVYRDSARPRETGADPIAAARSRRPVPADAGATQAGPGWEVQASAYRDAASARLSLNDARRAFPGLPWRVEEGEDGWFRLVLGPWPERAGAETMLRRVRPGYPSAWVRARSVP